MKLLSEPGFQSQEVKALRLLRTLYKDRSPSCQQWPRKPGTVRLPPYLTSSKLEASLSKRWKLGMIEQYNLLEELIWRVIEILWLRLFTCKWCTCDSTTHDEDFSFLHYLRLSWEASHAVDFVDKWRTICFFYFFRF